MVESKNSFNVLCKLEVGDEPYDYFALDAVPGMEELPYSLKVLGENLLRNEDGANITEKHVKAVANWVLSADPSIETQFIPARAIIQDFTGVACVVDLVTTREAVKTFGGDPDQVNLLNLAEMVVDRSVIIETSGNEDVLAKNIETGYQRSDERYGFPRWGTGAPSNFRVVSPGTDIVHQVNIEYLARVVSESNDPTYPNTRVGTSSHTTMQNGLGILGWGVGGIEAEAAALGQPTSMLILRVTGFKLIGNTQPGVTAADVVLTVIDTLRQHGVVGKFVEFYGAGVSKLPPANRATIGNMSPEPGSTAAIFLIDDETVKYLALTGRDKKTLERVEAHTKVQGMWLDENTPEAEYPEYPELDSSTAVLSIAGPKRPQDRIELASAKEQFRRDLHSYSDGEIKSAVKAFAPIFKLAADYNESREGHGESAANGVEGRPSSPITVTSPNGGEYTLDHDIATTVSITSCTNTSNPLVMIGAGLLARKAVKKGLKTKPWAETICAPGPQIVNGYFRRADLWKDLEALGLYLPGFGCATCISNSDPLPTEISSAISEADLAATAILSDNRSSEGHISPDAKMNYLASSILVIAYSVIGTMDFDFETDALGRDAEGNDVFLRNTWPSAEEIEATIEVSISSELYDEGYKDVFVGDERWQNLPTPEGKIFAWDDKSSYIRKAPYFDEMEMEPVPASDVKGARVLAVLGDSATTDHVSPAFSIRPGTSAAQYLDPMGVECKDYNSLGSRHGNHEVMVRGTFANIRLQNQLFDGVTGGYTRDFTQEGGPQAFIYGAAMDYKEAGTLLVVVGGKEYSTGSSRDWAAKSTLLLGVRAVITESFERIHRSNLIGMGVVPLQLSESESWKSLGIDGIETFDIAGLEELNNGSTLKTVKVTVTKENGDLFDSDATIRINTSGEADYYRHGGILQYALRNMTKGN